MVVIWRGYGIAVPIFGFGALIAGQLTVDRAYGDGYWASHRWPLATTALLFGVLLWFLGRHLNRHAARFEVDPHSGIEVKHYPGRHSFFYVPVEYVGVAIGVVTLGWLGYAMVVRMGATP